VGDKLRKEIEENTKEIITRQLTSFRSRVTEDSLATVQERVEAVNRGSESRIIEIFSRLDRLQDQVASNRYVQGTGGSAVTGEVIVNEPSGSSIAGTARRSGVGYCKECVTQ
jgi:hypothetical protein